MLIGTGFITADSDAVSVAVNKDAVPLMSVSSTHVIFQCPDLPAGTQMSVVLSDGVQSSNSVAIEMQEYGPGIFTTSGEGSGAGLVLVGDTMQLASVSPGTIETPAQPGEIVSIVATGLGGSFGTGPNALTGYLSVMVDGMSADVVSARVLGPGVYEVNARIPEHATDNEAVSLYLQVSGSSGNVMRSNSVEIGVHRPGVK